MFFYIFFYIVFLRQKRSYAEEVNHICLHTSVRHMRRPYFCRWKTVRPWRLHLGLGISCLSLLCLLTCQPHFISRLRDFKRHRPVDWIVSRSETISIRSNFLQFPMIYTHTCFPTRNTKQSRNLCGMVNMLVRGWLDPGWSKWTGPLWSAFRQGWPRGPVHRGNCSVLTRANTHTHKVSSLGRISYL